MRLCYVVAWVLAAAGCHKNVDDVTIHKRDLPGFSLSLPSGKTSFESLDYSQGGVQLDDIAGTGNVVRIGWEAGPMFDDNSMTMVGQTLGSLSNAKPEHGVGPQGAPTIAITVTTSKGPVRIIVTTCGSRRLMVMASESIALAQRIADSIACHPDASKEAVVDVVPWVAQLPAGWYAVPTAPKGQLWLTDGTNVVMGRAIDHMKDPTEVRELLEKLMPAVGVPMKLGDWDGHRYPLHGELAGKQYVGWAVPVACGARDVLLLAFGNDDTASQQLADIIAGGHCLATGEKPPVWPAPPKTP